MILKMFYLINLLFVPFMVGSVNLAAKTNNIVETNYENFKKINMAKGKLIRNFNDKERDKYYDIVRRGRKFIGWSTYVVNKNVDATFDSEVLFTFYNTGVNDIEYSKSITYDRAVKTYISTNGGLSYKGSGTNKKFKNNLDASVNFSYNSTQNVEQKQTDTLKFKVEPGYKAIIYMTGTARVTNGVASRYIFWFRQNIGTFEYFTITSLYPTVKKVKI